MIKTDTLMIIFLLLALVVLSATGCVPPTPTGVLTIEPATGPATSEQKSEDDSRVEFLWMLSGDEAGFTLALDSAIDLDDNLLVIVESDEFRIMKFDPGGNFLSGWGANGIGEGEFSYIPGISFDSIAVDSQGNIFVTDSGNNRVQKFDRDGNFITHWGSRTMGEGKLFRPLGLAVDQSGNVYVTDSWSLVQKFSNDGKFLLSFGEEGTGEGQFRHPTGIAVDNEGYVYVADYENQNIQKFDGDGQFIASWETGTDIGTPGTPESIAIDSLGRIHVTDLTLYRTEVFSSAGESLWFWGEIGLGEGKFFYPTGLSIDPEGNIYISDPERKTLQKFKLNSD
jgi:DNA-binding beta-propeller fold protein YncE